jgi:ELWxxDGT repeat protein
MNYQVLLFAFSLLLTSLSGAQTAIMVKDINPGPAHSYPQQIIRFRNQAFFPANDGVHGYELWVSDGSDSRTRLFKEINPGPAGGWGEISRLNALVMDDTLYFVANDGVHGDELWKSDGTPEGTVLVKDVMPGKDHSHIGRLVEVNGSLFFAATTTRGEELWKSDGTGAGTVLVKDIRPGNLGSFPHSLVVMNGTLYFAANDGASGVELWRSDGTEAGTRMVKDIGSVLSSGGLHSMYGYGANNLVNVNGRLYFGADDGVHGFELWKSDGTEAGTVLVKDIFPGRGGSVTSFFSGTFADVDGTLFFRATDGVHGYELWKTDGTEAGTVLIKDIRPGTGSYVADNCYPNFVTVAGTVYFIAHDGVHGYEMWKSDGTEAGTVMVKNIAAGPDDSSPGFDRFIHLNNTLYFTASDGIHGRELWQTDGTDAGTFMVGDIARGAGSGFPNYGEPSLAEVNGTLFFIATDAVHGWELWRITSQQPQTILFAPVSPPTLDEEAVSLTATASSGLPVAFSLVGGPATLSGNILTLTQPGMVTVKATQVGDHRYLPAYEVVQSFCVLPATPIINTSGVALTSSSPSGNQWYRDGAAIDGATAPAYQPTRDGSYAVLVSGPCGAPVASAALRVVVAAPEPQSEDPVVVTATEPGFADQVRLYPNPAAEKLILEISAGRKVQRVRVLDGNGREVAWRARTTGSQVIFDTSTCKSGLYLLEIRFTGTILRRKFVVR